MSNEADSRDTTPFPRWAETAAEVPSVNVTEPSGGKKDVGWLPGVDGIVGPWWNWLHWATGVFIRHIENIFALGLTRNHIMAGAAAGEGAVTAGVGLTVNVASSRCWLQGAMYVVPAEVNKTLTAADPTDPRIDIVVARVTGGVAAYTKITGTPAPSPSAPAALDTDAVMAEVTVPAAAAAPGAIVNRREFGAVSLDRIIAVDRLDAGSTGGADAMLYVDGPQELFRIGTLAIPGMSYASGAGFVVSSDFEFVGDIKGTTDFDGFQAGGDITLTGDFVSAGNTQVAPETFELLASITRKYDMSVGDFVFAGGNALALSGAPAVFAVTTGNVSDVIGAVRVPNGVVITAVRVRGTKTATDAFILIDFRSVAKATNASVFTDAANNNGTGTGAFSLDITGLAHAVDQNEVYYLLLRLTGGAGTITLWNAEVEYTEDTPFDGL